MNFTFTFTYCIYVNYTEGRHCCISMATRYVRARLDNTLYVQCLPCSFEASFVYVCLSVTAKSVRYWFSLVVYHIRLTDVAPRTTLSRCGNCNHALCWRPSTSLIYICLSCSTGSCSARTIPSDTIATYAGSPRCMGSLTACFCRTIEYIFGVAKEKSKRQEFSMSSVHSNPCLIHKFISNIDS